MNNIEFTDLLDYIVQNIEVYLEPDFDILAEKYDLIYQREDNGFCYCLKNTNIDIAYSKVFSKDEDDLIEHVNHLIWTNITSYLDELEKDLGTWIFSVERGDEYLCIPFESVDIHVNYNNVDSLVKTIYDNLNFNEFKTLEEVADYVFVILKQHEEEIFESKMLDEFCEGMIKMNRLFTVEMWEAEFRRIKDRIQSQKRGSRKVLE